MLMYIKLLQYLIIQYTICKNNGTYEHKIIKTITILMIMRTVMINDNNDEKRKFMKI